MTKRTIILGPTNELHPGVHGSLMTDPPKGFCYQRSSALHYFLLPKGTQLFEPLSPHRYVHIGEFLLFEGDAEFVHSSRFPVLEREAWVMDLDNFGYPFLLGRSILNPVHRDKLARHGDLPEEVKRRVVNMLHACIHPSCRAVMFRTRSEMKNTEAQLTNFGLQEAAKDLLSKARVVYPAQAALSNERVTDKWQRLQDKQMPFTIVFCGRDFAVKNGELALEVMRQLRSKYSSLRLIYIGQIPEDKKDSFAPVLRQFDFFSSLPRPEVLDLFAECHVLFHPSWNESLGTVYIEAFAAGMAVVGAYGKHLQHIPEILDPEGAFIVNYEEVEDVLRVDVFREVLQRLIEEPKRAERMGTFNHSLTASNTGRFSLAMRNRELEDAYQFGIEKTQPLRLEDLPYWKESVAFSMPSDDVQRDFKEYAREIGFSGFNLVV